MHRPSVSSLALGLLLVAVGSSSLRAAARAPVSWTEPTFGFEFTFRGTQTANYAETWRLIERLVLKAPEFARRFGVPVIRTTSASVYFAPESRVTFGTDPRVLEVTGTPQTVAGYETNRLAYQTLTFGLLGHFATFPDEIIGGGHIHIGGVFARDAQLLRDFTVDFNNHPSLAIGIFAYNPHQGLAMAEHSPEEQLEYLQAVADFDASNGSMTSPEFAFAMFGRVRRDRRVALNFLNIDEESHTKKNTLELRIMPQQSFQDFLLITRLLRARLSWLKRHSHQPASVPPGPRSFTEAQAEFRGYVEECGLDWREYEHFGIASWKENPTTLQRAHAMTPQAYEKFLGDVAKLKGQPKDLPEATTCEFPLDGLGRAGQRAALAARP